uniref:Uncharacterized protein n=1 Tax=Equus caballus TaxID=9796 RepID=A0A9L0TBC6_HORSE
PSTAGAGAGGGGRVAGGCRRAGPGLAEERRRLRRRFGEAARTGTVPILVALLTLHVAPLAVLQMLCPCAEQRLPSEPQASSSVPESRGQRPLSAKNCSPRKALHFLGPGPVTSVILLHSPTALHSPLSPGPPGSFQFSCCPFSPFTGCRNKGSSALIGGQALAELGGQALAELGGQEASGQRMSHQPSAARLLRGCVCVGGPGKSPPRSGP